MKRGAIPSACRRLLDTLAHPATAAIALALLSLVLAIASAFPQITPTTAGDAYRLARWLSRAQVRYGDASETLAGLGLFRIGRSPLLWCPLGLLLLSLLAWAIRRLPSSWRLFIGTASCPHNELARAPLLDKVDGASANDKLAEHIIALLRRRRLRTQRIPRDGGTCLRINRHRWARLGPILSHLAIWVLLAGALLSAYRGERSEIVLSPTDSIPGLALVSITLPESPYDAPRALLRSADGQELTITPYRPAFWRGQRLYWVESWHVEQDRYLALATTHDPGWPLVLAGGIALCLGLLLALYWPASSYWLLIGRDGTLRLLADAGNRGGSGASALGALARTLREGLRSTNAPEENRP